MFVGRVTLVDQWDNEERLSDGTWCYSVSGEGSISQKAMVDYYLELSNKELEKQERQVLERSD